MTIAAVENAMIARLQLFSDATTPGGDPYLGYEWKLATYPADWDALLKEKGQINPPAVWVGFAGSGKAEETSAGEIRVQCSFGITVIAKNLRSEQARRHGFGAGGEPGSYQLMEDALGILVGSDLGGLLGRRIELGAVRHVRPGEALKEMKASMMAAELRTSIIVPVAPAVPGDGALDDFEAFHANWDIAPFGGIDADSGEPGIQLPDDDQADATDHVELEQ